MFSGLERWSPPRALVAQGEESAAWPVVSIGELVQQVTDRITAEAETEYRMAGVRWYAGGVFHRETVLGKDMSASKVTPLVAGALIYNRLFAWKESFGVVEDDHNGLCVSNEFPQFIADRKRILPKFLYLFCTIPSTTALVNAASAGSAAVSRNRFKESEFESFKLRLPPLATQRAIVARWEDAQEKCSELLNAADEEETKSQREFLVALGLGQQPETLKGRSFALRWSEVERWGVDGLRKGIAVGNPSRGIHPTVALGSVLELVQYGTSEKANEDAKGVPVLRIGNIKEGGILWDNLKHIELSENALEGLLLENGDILIIRTSGSRGLVGTCGVYRGDQPSVFASYLIRLRVDPAKADPDFVGYFINSESGQRQVDAVSRQIMQNNINSQEIRELQLPLPPLAIQKYLVKTIATVRIGIAEKRAAAAELKARTAIEIEEMILGHRVVVD